MTYLFLHRVIYKEQWLEISLIPSLRWASYTTPPNVSLMGANGLNQIMMIYYVLDFLIRRDEKGKGETEESEMKAKIQKTW